MIGKFGAVLRIGVVVIAFAAAFLGDDRVYPDQRFWLSR
jgi:hypothetical protein